MNILLFDDVRFWLKREANFFRIHLLFFLIVPLISAGIFYAANGEFHIGQCPTYSSSVGTTPLTATYSFHRRVVSMLFSTYSDRPLIRQSQHMYSLSASYSVRAYGRRRRSACLDTFCDTL